MHRSRLLIARRVTAEPQSCTKYAQKCSEKASSTQVRECFGFGAVLTTCKYCIAIPRPYLTLSAAPLQHRPVFCTFFCESHTFGLRKNALLGRNCADRCKEESCRASFCNLRVTNETSAGHFSRDVFISTSGLRCHNEKQHTGSPSLPSEISHSSVSEPVSFKANKEPVGAANASLLTQ